MTDETHSGGRAVDDDEYVDDEYAINFEFCTCGHLKDAHRADLQCVAEDSQGYIFCPCARFELDSRP